MDPKIVEEIKRRNQLKMQQWEDRLKIGKIGKGTDNAAGQSSADTSSGPLNDFLDKTEEKPLQHSAPAPSSQPAHPAAQAQSPDRDESSMAPFDIGPADPSQISPPTDRHQDSPQMNAEQKKGQTPFQPAKTVPDNAKQLHIDIIDGKIKISRKNLSMEQSLNLLAKVYNSYKKKLKK